MPAITAAGLRSALTNVGTSALYALFAYAHLIAFRDHPRASVGMAVVIETLFAFFLLVRRDSRQTSRSAWEWVVACAGTMLPLLLRPSGAAHDVAVGQVIQVLGSTGAAYGVLSLNRSIGIVPANRGVKSAGLYRWVRHPLYSTYTVAHAGYLVSNFDLRNLSVAVLALAAQLLRIVNEERLLSADPEYVAYKARTRWRLIPYLY